MKNLNIKLSSKQKYTLFFLLTLLLVGFAFYFQNELAKFGNFGLIGIFLINLVGSITLFLPAPGIASVFAGGIIYNPLLVALVAAFGSAIGDMVGFYLGKTGKEVLIKKDSFWFGIFKETFNSFGWLFIIVLALIPNPIFDAVGIIAGVFSYSPRKFFIYVFIGRLLRNILLAFVGSLF